MLSRRAKTCGWLVSIWVMWVVHTSVAQVYHFQHYDIFSGLGQSQVTDIEQDRLGYIWLSTRGGGLSRFDGLHFTTYRKEDNLPANNILSLEIDTKGTMYMGTPFGLSIYDGQRTRPVRTSDREPYTVSSVIGDTKGNVYAICNASQLGLLLGDSLRFLKKNSSDRPSFFSDMSVTPDGKLMVSTYSGEIFEVTPKGLFRRYNFSPALVLRSILFDNQGLLWLGTDEGVFTTKAKTPSALTPISHDIVHEMTEASDGSIWMGLSIGALRYQQGNILRFNADNGFSNFMVRGLLEDREGNLWFTTDGDGVYKFTNPAFTSLNVQTGLQGNTISSLALSPTGKLWVSYFDGGLDIVDTQTNRPLPVPQSLQRKRVNCLSVDNEGSVWIGLAGPGVYKVQTDKVTYFPLDEYISSQGVTLFMQAGNGKDVWISTSNGILLYDGKSFQHFHSKEGLKGSFVRRTLLLQSGELLTAGPRGLNVVRNGEVVDFLYDSEIASFPALSMAQRHDGLLALGSFEDGVVVFDPKTKQKHFFTVKQGLCSNLIYNTSFDQKGRLWIGTERGIDLLTLDAQFRIASIRHFNETDGFTARETNANTAYVSPNGDYWIGTIKGIFHYRENPKFRLPTLPKVHFTEVKSPFDTTNLVRFAKSKNTWYNVPNGLSLPHTRNQLKISFISINHSHPDLVRYQYQLEGEDEAWLGPTEQNSVVYSHLNPGRYRFKVRASLGDNRWGETAVYAFEIVPPFYQRSWFIALMISLLIASVGLAQQLYIQYRTRRVLAYEKLKQEAEAAIRVQLAQDFHDELGNRLAAIRMQSSVLKLRYESRETGNEEKRIVGEIEKNVVRLFRDTKDFIWAIDPESNLVKELILYIKDFGENLLQDTTIRFHSNTTIPFELENVTLPPGWSIQVIMIFKEALTNCIKHAQCQNIYFCATLQGRNVSFSLEDDGCGIVFPTDGYHKGLNNMRQRAEKIHCSLVIAPRLPSGTSLTLTGTIPTKTASPKIR